jgi:RNA polymerase sigma factor (sigma-70 family)
VSQGQFPSTRHSILAAVQSGDTTVRREALGEVIAAYWKPAYKYIRLKWRAEAEDARDLTQGFFAGLLERNLLGKYNPEKASFRTYLRMCIDGHVLNERKAGARLKRGGEAVVLGVDFQQAEWEIKSAAPGEAAEDVFEREWQRQMFALAIDDLRRAAVGDKAVRFRVFERYDLTDGARPSYESLAQEEGIPVTTVTNHLAWARRELRRRLMERLACITSGQSEMRREARRLMERR